MSLIGKKKVFVGSASSIKKIKNFIFFFSLFNNFKLKIEFPIKITKKNNFLELYPLIPCKKHKKLKSLWGTYRMHLFTLSNGASNNYIDFIQLIGVGYKLLKKQEKFILKLGLSHLVYIQVPFKKFYIKKIQKRPLLYRIMSADYDFLKNLLFFLRSFKKAEPYKGKGFSFKRELLKLKEGKKLKN